VKPKAIEELKNIISRDYSREISEDQARKLGLSLLRLTRIGVAVLARADEKNSSVQAREENSLQVPGESMQDL
jgi:hypothetical protein